MNKFRIFFAVIFCFTCFAQGRSIVVDQRKSELMAACKKAQYKFAPDVRAAYLAYQKALADDDLKAHGKKVSKKFQAWVDADPIVEATVYGTHPKPGDVLAHLFSLGMDMGRENLEKYTQLPPGR